MKKSQYRQVKELLSDKSKWTMYAMARDERGRSVLALDPSATCWCVLGACVKILNPPKEGAVNLVHEFPELYTINVNPPTVNDGRGYDAAMALLDKAIEIAPE